MGADSTTNEDTEDEAKSRREDSLHTPRYERRSNEDRPSVKDSSVEEIRGVTGNLFAECKRAVKAQPWDTLATRLKNNKDVKSQGRFGVKNLL